jgi:CO/xanthine dehydrogenase Mo-binding subunit
MSTMQAVALKPDRQSNHAAPAVSRRDFVTLLGAGLLIAVSAPPAADAQSNRGRQRGGRSGGRPIPIAARIHIGQDGVITVLTGKVECGQGARAEITQAATEELHVDPGQVQLVMADTSLVPDDGMTAGSRTTPSTVPAVRQGCAAAREILVGIACKEWNVKPEEVETRDAKVIHAASNREVTYASLATSPDASTAFAAKAPANVSLTSVEKWKVLGTPVPRPNARDLVTGGHHYPSDIQRPDMQYGAVLRPPSYGATLKSVDLTAAQAMKDVTPVQDGSFVAVSAKTAFLARQAIEAIAKTATWDTQPHASSEHLYDDLKQSAGGRIPKNTFSAELSQASKTLRQTYTTAYVQHAPMEPRAAVAEWEGDKLTVWTGTQNPFGVKSELERQFGSSAGAVRVIVPDFGGGFGGKHSGEAALEAARIAKAVNHPVSLRWTRHEEFTWAYFRPAAVIEVEAGLDAAGKLTSWHFININSGPSSIETPYRTGKSHSQFVQSTPPLRHGSYRGLAATANTFARECAMDELAALAGADPLQFRLAHLDEPRLRAVLERAAKSFDWAAQVAKKDPTTGVGIACGTEKGAYVATCAQVAITENEISVRKVSAAFECGTILNPGNLTSQIQGAITMGLGPALREEIRFQDGKIQNGMFADYRVPRFADVPELEVHLINRPDLPSSGAGETPLISIAPAIANAVFQATGTRLREMPMRLLQPKAT